MNQNSLQPSEMVALLRRVFGLNVSDAAQVFGVNHPTIYLWGNINNMRFVQPANQARMQQLFKLAQLWEELGTLHFRALHVVMPESGMTLLEMLSKDIISPEKILQAHQLLNSMSETFRQQEHIKALVMIKRLRGAFSAMAANESARNKN